MPIRLPTKFVENWSHPYYETTFIGIPISELDHDELLAVVRFIAEKGNSALAYTRNNEKEVLRHD